MVTQRYLVAFNRVINRTGSTIFFQETSSFKYTHFLKENKYRPFAFPAEIKEYTLFVKLLKIFTILQKHLKHTQLIKFPDRDFLGLFVLNYLELRNLHTAKVTLNIMCTESYNRIN